MSISAEAQEFFDWRDRQRKKHRTMTIAEYDAWCCRGDAISSPSCSNAFPGGITIIFGDRNNSILGKVSDET